MKVPEARFYLKNSKAQKESLICLAYRLPKEKLRITFSTKEYCPPKFWNNHTRRVKNSIAFQRGSAINNELNKLANLTEDIFREFEGNISTKDFKEELEYRTGRKKRKQVESKKPESFFDFIEIFIQERINKPNASRGTWKIFRTVFNHLKKYSKEKDIELDYGNINFEFRHDFESWLYSDPRNHSKNYASKMFEILRQFLNEATRREYNTNLTFKKKGWTIPKEDVHSITLSFRELKILYDLDLSNNKRLEGVRDLFLIGCYTGLRYSDFTRITPQNVKQEQNAKFLHMITIKTGTEVFVPILPMFMNILQRYNLYSPKAISNQKMNNYIKEVGELAGLNELVKLKKSKGGQRHDVTKEKYEFISTHTARRSFATNFYEMGFTAFELMQITGHKTETEFLGYINVSKKRNAQNMASRMAKMMSEGSLDGES